MVHIDVLEVIPHPPSSNFRCTLTRLANGNMLQVRFDVRVNIQLKTYSTRCNAMFSKQMGLYKGNPCRLVCGQYIYDCVNCKLQQDHQDGSHEICTTNNSMDGRLRRIAPPAPWIQHCARYHGQIEYTKHSSRQICWDLREVT